MIGKISHGNSFSDCLDYLTRVKQDRQPPEKRVWNIIDSDGVRLNIGEDGWRKMAASDVERPTLTRSKIKDPCGHISLGFAPNDSNRMTDDFMLRIAHEYMEKMDITDTPYIIVRHTDKEHPHCHIMFSRVNYNGKIIKPVTNLYRNKAVCADITKRHNLTMGTDSLSLDTSKLRGSERSRVEIIQAATEVLHDVTITDWPMFKNALARRGIIANALFSGEGDERKLKTIIYRKGRHSFVASKIGKSFTPAALVREFKFRSEKAEQQKMANTPDPTNRWVHIDGSPIAQTEFGGIQITPEQQQDYIKGRTIRVNDAYIWFDYETKQPQVSRFNPDMFSDRGCGLPLSPGADPEYVAFYGDLSEQFRQEFRRFRKRHPSLTNSEAMQMFKTNYGQSHRLEHSM
ncbi:relaxase/mobilization nuclease domain-containing protein [Bacteroides acidifaciens]|uniref:relaxase/mobilization nuclease domain-containing protein n=1 Tax=Bacteroides acidifaciens TaxID=85831 RepID=UPI0025AE5686|nr:relaxase/mobilization nuclease domain-containing protein [Bacteroides acidifaciens]